jgi:hypothetical protein
MPHDTWHWFSAKRYGWGWGLPATWQGWVVLCAFCVLLVVGFWAMPPQQHPLVFAMYVLGLVALLMGVCWLTGEPPRWRWGKEGPHLRERRPLHGSAPS